MGRVVRSVVAFQEARATASMIAQSTGWSGLRRLARPCQRSQTGVQPSGSAGWLPLWDLLFLLIIPGLIVSRWVEQRSGAATTITGEPATPAHLRRYTRVVVPVALAAWLAANIVGNHLLR